MKLVLSSTSVSRLIARVTACRKLMWGIALLAAAIPLAFGSAIAHPLQSEIIVRPCKIYQEHDQATLIEGRCSFVVAIGYVIFVATAAPDKIADAPKAVSGEINLSQATGSVFARDDRLLADGPVVLPEQTAQLVHMEPGTMVTWRNGYVLEVSGTATRVEEGASSPTQATGSASASQSRLPAERAIMLSDKTPEPVQSEAAGLAKTSNGLVPEDRGATAPAEDYVADTSGIAVPAWHSAGVVAQQNSEKISTVITQFLELGFLHIIPRGFDHILFVIGLFLLSRKSSALLLQVSAFTVAHTITLALGATGVVRLSPNIIEPLIALSIVWVAIENIASVKLHWWRIGAVFCFGLLHGLGFAGVLHEIGFSGTHFVAGLLAFNVGVEIGQLTVIVLCFLGVGWAMKRPDHHRHIVVPASCVIALIASYWFLQRIGFA